jgi:hypothetical protein
MDSKIISYDCSPPEGLFEARRGGGVPELLRSAPGPLTEVAGLTYSV